MATALIITLILIMMQKKETTLAIIAIVAALGLLGLVVTESIAYRDNILLLQNAVLVVLHSTQVKDIARVVIILMICQRIIKTATNT